MLQGQKAAEAAPEQQTLPENRGCPQPDPPARIHRAGTQTNGGGRAPHTTNFRGAQETCLLAEGQTEAEHPATPRTQPAAQNTGARRPPAPTPLEPTLPYPALRTPTGGRGPSCPGQFGRGAVRRSATRPLHGSTIVTLTSRPPCARHRLHDQEEWRRGAATGRPSPTYYVWGIRRAATRRPAGPSIDYVTT